MYATESRPHCCGISYSPEPTLPGRKKSTAPTPSALLLPELQCSRCSMRLSPYTVPSGASTTALIVWPSKRVPTTCKEPVLTAQTPPVNPLLSATYSVLPSADSAAVLRVVLRAKGSRGCVL